MIVSPVVLLNSAQFHGMPRYGIPILETKLPGPLIYRGFTDLVNEGMRMDLIEDNLNILVQIWSIPNLVPKQQQRS